MLLWNKKMEKLPKEYEMEKIMLNDKLSDNLTYPESFKIYFDTVVEKDEDEFFNIYKFFLKKVYLFQF